MPALREFSAEAQTRFDIEFQVHIGINSGVARVGIVGSPWLMFYTAVGWTVQLAWAMLDEAQRRGLPILFSGETRKLLPGDTPLRMLEQAIATVEKTQIEVCTLSDN
jgi:class 3 adenylate cyclase